VVVQSWKKISQGLRFPANALDGAAFVFIFGLMTITSFTMMGGSTLD
jgi:hypothetical protein